MKRVTSTNNIELESRLVAINRVSKVTKGGRTFSLAAIVVVGDGKGIIGYGLGRSNDTSTAITKGTDACLLYTSPSPRDGLLSRMPSSA